MDKNYIRKEILKTRDDIEVVLKKEYDSIIFKRLINSDTYKNANKIFTYISFGSEVDTKEFIKYALSDILIYHYTITLLHILLVNFYILI